MMNNREDSNCFVWMEVAKITRVSLTVDIYNHFVLLSVVGLLTSLLLMVMDADVDGDVV